MDFTGKALTGFVYVEPDGFESDEASLDKKTQVWEKIANEFKINTLNELVDEISLDEIQQAYQKILQAKAVGRYLVKL
jgi:D-arabinose 1-dehydrogenase-like Zn-dependent alcohol dehydrogenase